MSRVIIAAITALLLIPGTIFPAMFPELTVATDARTVAMGNTFAPIAEGASAVNLNPAGLGSLQKVQVGISYNSWILDTSLQEFNIAVPLQYGAWGADISYFNMGVFDTPLDDYGNPTGKEIRPYNLQITGAYGVPVFSYYNGIENKIPSFNLLFGFSGKYLVSNLDEDFTQAISLDMGIKMEMSGFFNAAFVLKNLSLTPSLKLPSSLSAGISGKMRFDGQNQLIGAVSLNQLIEGTIKYNAGVEYSLANVFFIRLGYELDPVLRVAEGTYSGFSIGTGLVFQSVQLDYAYLQKGAAGNSQVITLTYKF